MVEQAAGQIPKGVGPKKKEKPAWQRGTLTLGRKNIKLKRVQGIFRSRGKILSWDEQPTINRGKKENKGAKNRVDRENNKED